MIHSVIVTHDNIGYLCEAWDAGFLCGKCGTPLPKMPPAVCDRCQSCKALVTEVRHEPTDIGKP